jgi:hypothetical protein
VVPLGTCELSARRQRGDGTTDTVTVTDKTINIDGVKCVVVSDIVKEGKKTPERTKDYFAQDNAGNVWYLGENTKTF